jgi:hypothetical protein
MVCSAFRAWISARARWAASISWVAGAVYLTVQILSDYVFVALLLRAAAIKERERRANRWLQRTGLATAVFALSAVAWYRGVFMHQSAYINSDAFT